MEQLHSAEDRSRLALRVPADRPEAGDTMALVWEGTVVATNSSPVAIQVFDGNSVSWQRTSYATVTRTATGFRARGEMRIAGARIEVDDTYAIEDERLYIDRSLVVQGTAPGMGFLSACEWRLSLARPEDPRFIPGVWYGRNEHVPPYAIGAATQRAQADSLMVREDRLPLPLIMRFHAEPTLAVCLAHLAARPETIAADDGDAPLVDERLAFGSLGEGDGGTTIAFWFPGTEGEVCYPPMWTLGIGNAQADSPVNPFVDRQATNRAQGWSRRYHPLHDGLRQAYRLCMTARHAPNYEAALASAWRMVYEEYRPPVHAVNLARVEQVSLELLAAQVRRDASATGIPTWIDCFTGREGPLQNTFGIGFVSRNLEAAWLLIDAGHRQQEPGLVESRCSNRGLLGDAWWHGPVARGVRSAHRRVGG